MRFLLNSILVGFLVMLMGGIALAEQNGGSPEEASAKEPEEVLLGGEGEEEDFIDESEFIDVFDLHGETEPVETGPKEQEKDAAAKKAKMPPLRTGGIVALGAGGAALIASAVTGALALQSNNYIKDNCIDGICSTQESQDELDKRDNLVLSTNILLGAGAGIAIAGALMVVFSYDWKKSREKNKTGKGVEESISLRPMLGPGMVGTTVEWRF
jgi:hypothetical protein